MFLRRFLVRVNSCTEVALFKRLVRHFLKDIRQSWRSAKEGLRKNLLLILVLVLVPMVVPRETLNGCSVALLMLIVCWLTMMKTLNQCSLDTKEFC
mmetsp:Transcript_3459/g.7169  ORF Transcript_3459/g.7169 Transcript_3459/m.7169 type:complete len:96 (+) Transcript_3459:473-760(+)